MMVHPALSVLLAEFTETPDSLVHASNSSAGAAAWKIGVDQTSTSHHDIPYPGGHCRLVLHQPENRQSQNALIWLNDDLPGRFRCAREHDAERLASSVGCAVIELPALTGREAREPVLTRHTLAIVRWCNRVDVLLISCQSRRQITIG